MSTFILNTPVTIFNTAILLVYLMGESFAVFVVRDVIWRAAMTTFLTSYKLFKGSFWIAGKAVGALAPRSYAPVIDRVFGFEYPVVSSIIGGGSMFVLYCANILTPRLVLRAISSILSCGSSLVGGWVTQSVTMVVYCCKLIAINLPPAVVSFLESFIYSFFVKEVVEDGASILARTTAEKLVRKTAEQIAKEKWARETILKATEGVSGQTFTGNIWSDDSIPTAVKIFSAVKTWATLATSYCIDSLAVVLGEQAATAVAYCVGFVIAGLAASWLSNKIYKIVFGNTLPKSLECGETFNKSALSTLESINKIYENILGNKSTEENSTIVRRLAAHLSAIPNCENSNFQEKIIQHFRNFEISADLIILSQNVIEEVNKFRQEIIARNSIGTLFDVEKAYGYTILQLEILIQDLQKREAGGKIPTKRQAIDQDIFALVRASEAVENQIPVLV